MSIFYFMGNLGYGEPLKKSCFVRGDFLPVNMNTHII